MTPIDIGPHPDAPDHYFRFGKPPSWDEKDCATLCVRRVGATTDMLAEPAARVVKTTLPSGEDVYPAYLSEWTPSAAELELLNAGQPMRLLLSGNSLPPVALWVRAEDEV